MRSLNYDDRRSASLRQENARALRRSDEPRRVSSRTKPKRAAEKPEKNVVVISHYDTVILMSIVLLVLFGVAMVFSSSYYTSATTKAYNYDMFFFLKKQIRAVALGSVAFIMMGAINYRVWKRFSLFFYILANGLLIAVKFFGKEINGARRWLELPLFGSFQPSEFAKVALVLFLATFIAASPNVTKSWKGFLGCGIIIGIPCVLVFWGGNLSTAIILCAIGFGMVFVASPYFWPFIAMGGAAVAGLWAFLQFFATGFRSARFDAWQDPFSDPLKYGFQTIQSLYAVASGGLFGLGLGQSRQKLIFMPEPHNDFIFAIICEELGFFGAALVLMLFCVLIWRGFRVSLNAPDAFGSLVAFGAMVMIAVQVIINVAVVTNTIPNTGIPLPFISYGGTSIAFLMFLMGIVLNISRYSGQQGSGV